MLCFIFNFGFAQEWMTSLSVAERLALVQNKMLFVMLEDATTYPFSVKLTNERGKSIITDLFDNEQINTIIWEYFIPVRLPEDQYLELFSVIEGKRSSKYINKFNDDGIMIMDVNNNILNVDEPETVYLDLGVLIENYSLNTVYLKPAMLNYREHPTFSTALRLALKYYDFAIFYDKSIKRDIIDLSTIYIDEAKELLEKSDDADKLMLMQRFELHELKQYLVLNRPKKVLRLLKKIDPLSLHETNKPLMAYLNYAAYKMLGKDRDAELWKNEVSSVNLKKVQLIINSNK